MSKIFFACVLLSCLEAGGLKAQDSLGWQRNQVIGINFQKRTLEPSYLPFDVPYRLYVVAPDSLGIDSVWVQCFRVRGKFRNADTTSFQPLQTTYGRNHSLNSKLLFRHDTYSRGDTLYANVGVPLRPNQSYTFRCTVYRRVTDRESQDLDSIFTPLITQTLDSIYNSSCSRNILSNLQSPDSTNFMRGRLIDAMTDRVQLYYARKSVDPDRDSVRRIIAAGLPQYLARTYGTIATKRLSSYEQVIADMKKAVRYADSRSCIVKLRDWKLFIKLDSLCRDTVLCKKYGIDAVTRQFIRGILMDDDSLLLSMTGKKSEAEPDFSEGKLFPAGRVNAFRAVVTSFYDSCGRVSNLIKTIQRDPDLAGVFKGRDSAAIFLDREFYLYSFYIAVQKIKMDLDAYYDLSIAFDTLTAKAARFNFKNEFPIHFHDKSIGLTSADFITRGAWYIIADIGFAYVNTYPTGQVRPYVGVNFNVFPINRQASYSLFKHPYYTCMGNIIRSLSVTAGLTVLSTFGAKDRYTELLGTTGSLLTGLALRLSDGVRLSGGALWAYQKSGNPLSDMKTLVPLGYGSLSVDLTLKKWLGGLAKVFN